MRMATSFQTLFDRQVSLPTGLCVFSPWKSSLLHDQTNSSLSLLRIDAQDEQLLV